MHKKDALVIRVCERRGRVVRGASAFCNTPLLKFDSSSTLGQHHGNISAKLVKKTFKKRPSNNAPKSINFDSSSTLVRLLSNSNSKHMWAPRSSLALTCQIETRQFAAQIQWSTTPNKTGAHFYPMSTVRHRSALSFFSLSCANNL